MTELTDEAVEALVNQLQNFAQGCRGSMWQSRDETIRLCDEAARALLDARAEAGKMLAEADHDYNRQTNDLIERHAKRISTLAAELAQARADAQAAVALVVERAEHLAREIVALESLCDHDCDNENCVRCFHYPEILEQKKTAIRALADTDGLALVQALRAERDAAREALMNAGIGLHVAKREAAEAVAERDRLAASNAALEAQVARLVAAIGRINDKAIMNAGEFSKYVQDEIAALAEVQADARREGGA